MKITDHARLLGEMLIEDACDADRDDQTARTLLFVTREGLVYADTSRVQPRR